MSAKKVIPAVLATVVLGGLVLAFFDLRPEELSAGVLERLRDLHAGPLALAFVVYLASYFGRAIRFAVLLPGLHGLVHLASIAGRHNFLNLVLPFRSGELALPLMLKKEHGRSLAEGSAALVVARVLDLLCVAAWLTTGLLLRGVEEGGARAETIPRAAALAAVLAGGLFVMGPICRWLSPRLEVAGEPHGLRGKVQDFAHRTTLHMGALTRGRLALAAVVSLGTWALTYATYYFMLRAMAGPDPVGQELGAIDFTRSLVGTTGLHLSTVLPVNTLGGLGSWELGWVSGYVLLADLGEEAAGVSAVVTHLVNFVFITIIGGLGFLLRKRPDAAAAGDGAPGGTPGGEAGDAPGGPAGAAPGGA